MRKDRALLVKNIAAFILLILFSASIVKADYKYNYYSFDEIEEILKNLEKEVKFKTPQVYSLQIIGYSNTQNPIYAVKFSDKPALEQADKPVVVIDSGIHGNEWLPVDSNIHFIQYLFDAYYNTAHPDHNEVIELVNNFEIWVIPLLNPDGRIRDDINNGDPDKYWTDTTYHVDDSVGWRMDVQEVACLAKPGGTNQGIDINRTFSNKFWDLSDCTTTNYNGGSPFAAVESRVMKQFINNHMVSLVLHQHSNIQIIYSASGKVGLGDYLSAEADAVYEEGMPNPLLALTNGLELTGGTGNILRENFNDNLIHIDSSGVCNGSVFSGQYYEWLWAEIDCILAPDNHSRRAIQSVFYEYPYIQYFEAAFVKLNVYGVTEDGKIGQYAREDGSNGFHPSSGELNQWIIDKSVEINKYIIKQSRYPFSPRNHADMSRRPEDPQEDLAIVGAKITEVGEGLNGSFTFSETDGRDLLDPGNKRITWNIQNNGTGSRTINSTITICNLTDDPGCANPVNAELKAENIVPEAIKTFTHDYAFTPEKDYTVTITTGEDNSYKNDLKRFVFTTTAASNRCPAALLSGYDVEKITQLRDFRDTVLLKTSAGTEYVQLFYKHTAELFSLLCKDISIRSQAVKAFTALLPEIKSARERHEVVVSRSMKAEIEKLCDTISVKASPELKKTIKKVRHDISEQKLFNRLGIKVN